MNFWIASGTFVNVGQVKKNSRIDNFMRKQIISEKLKWNTSIKFIFRYLSPEMECTYSFELKSDWFSIKIIFIVYICWLDYLYAELNNKIV